MPIGLGSPGVSPGTPGLLPSLAPTYDVVFVDQTVVLQVYIDGILWDQAYQAVIHRSLDRRYGTCEIHFTGGERATLDGSPAPPVPAITYWSRVEVKAGCTPDTIFTHFKGWVVPVDNNLENLSGVLNCLGMLYVAEYVKNPERTVYTLDLSLVTLGGVDMAEMPVTGTVTKVEGSATLVGTGTAFTSELRVNGSIFVPGNNPTDPDQNRHEDEQLRITNIVDDTTLEVAQPFAYSAADVPAFADGQTDEQMAIRALTKSGTPFNPAFIGGTGIIFGAMWFDRSGLANGPFWVQEGESWLSFLDKIDQVSIPNEGDGRFRTYELSDGNIKRAKLSTNPQLLEDHILTQGRDIATANIRRDPSNPGNRVVVTGYNYGDPSGPVAWIATTEFAPYIPSFVPPGPLEGFPVLPVTFSSDMIEKEAIADGELGRGVSAEQTSTLVLAEADAVLETMTLTTPRDDVFEIGETVYVNAPSLGTDRRYLVQETTLTIGVAEYTMQLSLVVKN
jgi:hypothetical protein